MNIKILNRAITAHEYQTIRSTTNWAVLDNSTVKKALCKDLYSVLAFDNDKLIGIGRVVGDGAIYFYIQDIIVIPEYQGKGIGKIIMQNIEEFLCKETNENSFIGLMAADGVQKFYYQFGYKERPENKPGMFKMINKKEPAN